MYIIIKINRFWKTCLFLDWVKNVILDSNRWNAPVTYSQFRRYWEVFSKMCLMLLTIQKKMICMLDQLSNLILNNNLCIIFVRNLTDMTGKSQEEVLSDSTIALKQKSNCRNKVALLHVILKWNGQGMSTWFCYHSLCNIMLQNYG